MTPEQLKMKIESMAPGTRAQVNDTTGTQDHYEAIIVSSVFEGKTRIDRQRFVMELLDRELKSGEIHALTMKTWTPVEGEKFLKA